MAAATCLLEASEYRAAIVAGVGLNPASMADVAVRKSLPTRRMSILIRVPVNSSASLRIVRGAFREISATMAGTLHRRRRVIWGRRLDRARRFLDRRRFVWIRMPR